MENPTEKTCIGVENFNSFARQCDSFSCRCVHHFDTLSVGLLINFRLLFAFQCYITFPSFAFVHQMLKKSLKNPLKKRNVKKAFMGD